MKREKEKKKETVKVSGERGKENFSALCVLCGELLDPQTIRSASVQFFKYFFVYPS